MQEPSKAARRRTAARPTAPPDTEATEDTAPDTGEAEPASTPPPRPPRPGTRAPDWPGIPLSQDLRRPASECGTWQQRMRDRGWPIVVDRWYGPKSEDACRAFQREKGLAEDGVVGPITWRATWEAPIT